MNPPSPQITIPFFYGVGAGILTASLQALIFASLNDWPDAWVGMSFIDAIIGLSIIAAIYVLQTAAETSERAELLKLPPKTQKKP